MQSFVVLTIHDYSTLVSMGRRRALGMSLKLSLASLMGSSSLELGLFSFVIALLALHAYYKHRTDPLSRVPSLHWSAPFSRVYILWQIYQNKRRYAHSDAHWGEDGEVRPLVRVAPTEVSIMTIEGTKIVYDGGFERTSHYTVFQNFG